MRLIKRGDWSVGRTRISHFFSSLSTDSSALVTHNIITTLYEDGYT